MRPGIAAWQSPAGHVVRTIETGSADRVENMRVFAAAALALLEEAMGMVEG